MQVRQKTLWGSILSCLICVGSLTSLNAQDRLAVLNEAQTSQLDSNSLYVKVYSLTFFKNNEYFNDIVEGYTLPGAHLRPQLVYAITPKHSLTLGTALHHFGGEQSVTAFPIIRYQGLLADSLHLTLGSLAAQNNHHIEDALYSSEQNLWQPAPETGLQLQYNRSRFSADAWLNWFHFLRPNKNDQEQFVFGLRTNTILFETSKGGRLMIPLQLLLHHHGGQINEPSQPIQMYYNNAEGVCFEQAIGKSNLRLTALHLGFKSVGGTNEFPYNNGQAFLGRISIERPVLLADIGYWHASGYVSPMGETMYYCATTRNDRQNTKERSLAIARMYLKKNITSSLKLLFGVELFQELPNKILDYNFALYIRYDDLFFVHSFRKK